MNRTLNDVFNFKDSHIGIIHYLSEYTEFPPLTQSADLSYHMLRSGNKTISPLISNLLESYNKTIVDDNIGMLLALTIWNTYSDRWIKLWNTLELEYNPIQNYNMTETHTGTDTDTQTPTDWKETQTQTPTDWKETEVQTPTEWKTTNESKSSDNESNTHSSVYGFNSSNPVPTNDVNTTINSRNETTQTGLYETETERTGTYETETERTGTYETKKAYNTTLTREGNIGVMSTQDMIQKERDLQEFVYLEKIFSDIDKMLVLSIY